MIDKEYFRAHSWLIYWHGRANKCQNPNCTYKNPKRYEWALKKGCKHEKNIDNYIQLCPSCHRKYDFNEDIRRKMSKSRKGLKAKNKRPVILNNTSVYESITDASNKTGISISSIGNNLTGLSKSTKIGVWNYKHEN